MNNSNTIYEDISRFSLENKTSIGGKNASQKDMTCADNVLLQNSLGNDRQGRTVSDRELKIWTRHHIFSSKKRPRGIRNRFVTKRHEWQATIVRKVSRKHWEWLFTSLEFVRERWLAFVAIAVIGFWAWLMYALVGWLA